MEGKSSLNPSASHLLPMELGTGTFTAIPGANNENRGPPPVPTGLNTMLRNTTETGDIGQFAIKLPRIPQRLNSPRVASSARGGHALHRLHQGFRIPKAVAPVDDRRGLPSYARDATSEIISMYETASQKSPRSPRFFGKPDYRSYSMTQASYSPYALSNHRSYASLRSQPEFSLAPHPGSPSRHRFRTPDNSRVNPPSISSFHPKRRVPSPLTLRSNYSPLSDSSRVQLPSLSPQGSTNDSPQDWNARGDLASRKTSLAESTFSLTSTTSFYHPRPLGSSVATPGKGHISSPLYYDYTEDFGVEETYRGKGTPNGPLPPLSGLMEVVIPEEKELISEPPRPSTPSVQPASNSSFLLGSAQASTVEIPTSQEANIQLNPEDDNLEKSTNVTQDIIPLYLDRGPYDNAVLLSSTANGISNRSGSEDIAARNNTPIGHTINDLSAHLTQYMTNNDVLSAETSHRTGSEHSYDHDQTMDIESSSNMGSSFRLSTYLPNFPGPPNQQVLSYKEEAPTARSIQDTIIWPNDLMLIDSPQMSIHAKTQDIIIPSLSPRQFPLLPLEQDQQDLHAAITQSTAPVHDNRIRSSRFYSIDHGLSDLAQLITSFEAANKSVTSIDMHSDVPKAVGLLSEKPPTAVKPHKTLQDPSKFPNEIIFPPGTYTTGRGTLNKFRSEGNLRAPQVRAKRTHNIEMPAVGTRSCNSDNQKAVDSSKSENFSHQIRRRSFSRSDSPILAPHPISPARILKLKNSVPQLMKALPAVPLQQSHDKPSNLLSQQTDSFFGSPSTVPLPDPNKAEIYSDQVQHEPRDMEQPFVQQVAENIPVIQSTLSQPKFKLKARLLAAKRSFSLPRSRPWNLNESYPWPADQSAAQISAVFSSDDQSQGTPKFKLRVTRASDVSSGTVRINPDAKRHRVVSSLELRHPKDLFTSATGLSEMFRQVGRGFSSRKSSASGEHTVSDSSSMTFTVLASTEMSRDQGQTRNFETALSPPMTANVTSPTEVRSFFSDDSSHAHGHNSFRKRISNLRARLPNPYAVRSTSQSNGTVVWRERGARSTTTIVPSELDPSNMQEDEYGMPLTEFRHRRLKSKVSSWFKEARIAVRRHIRDRYSDDSRCISVYR